MKALDNFKPPKADAGKFAMGARLRQVTDAGKVEEIVQPFPDGELYFIRFTTEPGGTKVEQFSPLTWTKGLKNVVSPCLPAN